MTMLFLGNRTASFENHYEVMSLGVRVTNKCIKETVLKTSRIIIKNSHSYNKIYNLSRENLQRPLLIDLRKAISETCLISHRGV